MDYSKSYIKQILNEVKTIASPVVLLATGGSGATYLYTTKPTISSFSISNNTSATVNINLAASDLGGVSKYYISESTNEPTISDTGWLGYSSFFTYEFQNKVAEEKTLYGWVIDQAGNISDVASTTTQLVDTSAPTGLNMSIASGSAF